MATKTVILCRFSPRRDPDDCESNEMQLEYCTKYAEKMGYEIIGRFADEALSGDAGLPGDDCERPGLWGAVGAMKRGHILLVWRRDRLARDPYLHEMLERQARKQGWRIEAVTGSPNGDDPQDELIRGVLANVDRYERRTISLRTRYAMLRHQENGRAMGSIPPLGKVRGPDVVVEVDGKKIIRRTLIDDEKEQLVVDRILREWKAGAGCRKIAKLLTSEGIPTKLSGKPWSHQTVAKVLRRNGIVPGARSSSAS